jgi:hypothetical protein
VTNRYGICSARSTLTSKIGTYATKNARKAFAETFCLYQVGGIAAVEAIDADLAAASAEAIGVL